MEVCLVVFFFSSRRRHTRYWRDWSSDVCSSDLALRGGIVVEDGGLIHVPLDEADTAPLLQVDGGKQDHGRHRRKFAMRRSPSRSEERRVGKECRSRWSPYH